MVFPVPTFSCGPDPALSQAYASRLFPQQSHQNLLTLLPTALPQCASADLPLPTLPAWVPVTAGPILQWFSKNLANTIYSTPSICSWLEPIQSSATSLVVSKQP